METEIRKESIDKTHVLLCLREIIKPLYFYISNSEIILPEYSILRIFS